MACSKAEAASILSLRLCSLMPKAPPPPDVLAIFVASGIKITFAHVQPRTGGISTGVGTCTPIRSPMKPIALPRSSRGACGCLYMLVEWSSCTNGVPLFIKAKTLRSMAPKASLQNSFIFGVSVPTLACQLSSSHWHWYSGLNTSRFAFIFALRLSNAGAGAAAVALPPPAGLRR